MKLRLFLSALTAAALIGLPACSGDCEHTGHDHDHDIHAEGHDHDSDSDHDYDHDSDYDHDHDSDSDSDHDSDSDSDHDYDSDLDHDHDSDSDHDSDHDHEHGGAHAFGSEIVLPPATAARFGVSVDTIVPGPFHQVLKVTGRIVDNPAGASVVSAPTAGIVRFSPGMQEGSGVASGTVVATITAEGISGGNSNLADKAAYEAAKRELDRLRPLYDEGIVSARDYNAALQAYEVARSQYSSQAASGQARAVGAGVISQLLVANGQYVETGTPIATVSAGRSLTLRADVPDRYAADLPLIQGASFVLPSTSEVVDIAALGGKRLQGAQQASRQQAGYVPVYFTFDNNGKTMPQTLVDVYLTSAPRTGVLTVPLAAVTEQQGHHFVYVQVDEEGYLKMPVTLGASDGTRVEVLSGLEPGSAVVVTGAGAVRLAETSGAVPEGHSHSH